MRALVASLVIGAMLLAVPSAFAVSQSGATDRFRSIVRQYILSGRSTTGGCFVVFNDGWFRCVVSLRTRSRTTIQTLGCAKRATGRIVLVDISRVPRLSNAPTEFVCAPASEHPGAP
jgi:hypothetical protein